MASRSALRPARLCRACIDALPIQSTLQPIPIHIRKFGHTSPVGSGHNRWSKIRHRKGAADAARSALFSRLTQEIHQSLRPPLSFDADLNPRLALALQRAKEGGVPKTNIENCVARAKSAVDGTGQLVTYEAVGPGGREAMIIECLSQNPNRTVTRVKEILNKNGCRISNVGYLFEKKGLITVQTKPGRFDELFELAVEHGAEDVREGEDDLWEVITAPNDLGTIASSLTVSPAPFVVASSDLVYIPVDPLIVGPEGITEQRADTIDKVVALLEEEGDVLKVWTNLE